MKRLLNLLLMLLPMLSTVLVNKGMRTCACPPYMIVDGGAKWTV
jgi:hypothetical protein